MIVCNAGMDRYSHIQVPSVAVNIRSVCKVVYISPLSPSYSWKLMVEAAFRKYPNPYSSHVHSLDTIQRRVSGSKIYSHRLFCTLWNIPAVVLKASQMG